MTHAGSDTGAGKLVTRNVTFLAVSQVVTAAISFGVTALLARHLGAEDYGVLYVSFAFVQAAFIFVDLGQQYYIVSEVARHKRRVGELFGSGIALRVVAAITIYAPVMAISWLLDYPDKTRSAISLMVVFHLISSVGAGFGVIFRGLERMEYEAVSQIAFKTFVALITVIAIALNANLHAIIEAQIVGAAISMSAFVLLLRRLRVPRARVRLGMIGTLLRGGAPFLLWSMVLTLLATTDAIMLSKLAPEEVVGWYGAAMKFVGILIFPSVIVASALYPTLSRLFSSLPEKYSEVTRSSLRYMLFVGVLMTVGTYLYADEAIALVYGEEAFGPAADVLQVLSPYILLLFIDVTLGTAVMAANRQTYMALVKGASVIFFIALNAVLIPFAQSRFSNGGMGSAAALGITELIMLGAAYVLTPRGTLERSLLRDLAVSFAGAGGMVVVTYVLGDVSVVVGILSSALAYCVVVVLVGGVRARDLRLLKEALSSRPGPPPIQDT